MASGDGKKGSDLGLIRRYNLQDLLVDWMWMMREREESRSTLRFGFEKPGNYSIY